MKYLMMKKRHEDEVENFPMFFAFSHAQLEEGMQKLNAAPKDLYKLPGGGFIRKTDSDAFDQLIEKMHREEEELFKDDEALKEAILYQLGNHEYGYTCDSTDAVEALGIDQTKKREGRILQEAVREFWRREEAINKRHEQQGIEVTK